MGPYQRTPKLSELLDTQVFSGSVKRGRRLGDFLERYDQRMAKLNMSKRQDGIREIHYRDSAKQGENQHLRSEKELPRKNPEQKQQVDWYHGNPENMLKTIIFGWLYCYTVDGSEILHQFLLQTESLNEST